jgi:hypothetical protein
MKYIAHGLACAVLAVGGLSLAPGAQAVGTGTDGCTPGYWKNHTSNWEEAGTNKKVASFFDVGSFTAVGNMTFLQALQGSGGTGTAGAARILARSAVAAWLNAAHDDLGYPLTRGEIGNMVGSAFASGSRAEMLRVAAELDSLNNSDCPLN